MIKHIFKQIWIERKLNSWIILELAVVFLFLLLMTDFLWAKIKNYMEPKGFDIENTFMLSLKNLEPIAPDYVSEEYNLLSPEEEINNIVQRIKLYPDVETVSMSIFSAPYSLGGIWNELKVDSVYIPSMRLRIVTPSYFDVFRIQSADGNPIHIEPAGFNQIILTKDIAELLYGSTAKAIGKEINQEERIDKEEETSRVVGVSTKLKRQDFYPYEGAYYEILSPHKLNDWLKTNDVSLMNIFVRVLPDKREHFLKNFEIDMGDRLKENNLYVATIIPSEKLREDVVGKTLREEILPMTYVMIFVLITVFLGVFGSFWLRTRQRRAEVAIRMVVGANRSLIRKYMIVEGLLLISIVILPAFLIYINLLHMEILNTWYLPFNVQRVIIAVCSALIITAIMVIGGILWPAKRTSAIELAEALRDE